MRFNRRQVLVPGGLGEVSRPVLALCLLAVGTAATGDAETLDRRFLLMGTEAEIVVEATDRTSALAASEVALEALETTEDRLSTWRDDSELASLNRAPVGRPTSVSPELAEELVAALDCRDRSDGAFDPTVGSLVDVWHLRRGGRVPSAGEIEEAMASTGSDLLRLEPGFATRLHPGLKIEEGGFGKGAGLDRATAALADTSGLHRARIDLGGQVALIGPGPWRIGVADPRDRDLVVARLTVSEGSVATTANSERGVAAAGTAIGHVLDPRTGRPATTTGSVTVWAERALEADCSSTALFVAGPRRAIGLAEKLGVEALVLTPTDEGIVARATAGLEAVIEPLVDDFDLLETRRSDVQEPDDQISR